MIEIFVLSLKSKRNGNKCSKVFTESPGRGDCENREENIKLQYCFVKCSWKAVIFGWRKIITFRTFIPLLLFFL